jgi:hypothetical protein
VLKDGVIGYLRKPLDENHLGDVFMRLSMLVNGLANVWLRLRARQGKLKLNTFRLIRAFYRFGPGLLVNRLSHLPALSHVDASGTSQVPGGPSGAFASVLDPGRIDDPSPWPRRCCPCSFDGKGFSIGHIGATAGLQHRLSTLHE